MKVNFVVKENESARSHLINYSVEDAISRLKSAILVLGTHRDSWALRVDWYRPNHSEHDQESKLTVRLFTVT